MTASGRLDIGGWSVPYILTEGGLVLQRVQHGGFFLANDIRVVRVWAGSGDPAESEKVALNSFVLGADELPCIAGPEVLESPTASRAFPFYPPIAGLRGSFVTKEPVLGTSHGSSKLKIVQEYLFTAYGKTPPHEPGHVLDAARLFPLMSFEYLPDDSLEPLQYLRFDYRLHLNLDTMMSRALDLEVAPNMVSLLRDAEQLPAPVQFDPNTLLRPVDIQDVFAAGEKPLQYEVVAPGLHHGLPSIDGEPATWDNIHQWPAVNPEVLASSPGAFHAAHLHWRWGSVSGQPGPLEQFLLPGGEHFKGYNWTDEVGGPLIDPRIPNQSITVAITRNSPQWAADKNPSTRRFADLFTSEKPREMNQGGDIVLWLSAEVFRDREQAREPWAGTVFVHGFYFAHNPERIILQTAAAGAYHPLLNPKPKREWFRTAITKRR